MPAKLTTDIFIAKAIAIHGDRYDYSCTLYVNSTTKVTIGCSNHGTFQQIPNTHINAKIGCPKCDVALRKVKMTYTTSEFIKRANNIHNNVYDYSLVNYINIMNHVKIICKKHGEFHQTPNDHINSGHGCPKCGNIMKSIAKTLTTEHFIGRAQQVHGNKYDYSLVKYVKNNAKIQIICMLHGTFIQTPNDHINSRSGCPTCGVVATSLAHTNTTEYFIGKARQVHGNKYDYSLVNYTTTHDKVIIICKDHGAFRQRPNDHIGTGENGCPKCGGHVSTKETYWLNSQNVPDTSQFRQVCLRIDGIRYKVDGFDSTTNTVYEFWGDFWHGHPTRYNSTDINQVAHKTFGELYEKTQQKRQSILNAGYNLVEIWESDYDSNFSKETSASM